MVVYNQQIISLLLQLFRVNILMPFLAILFSCKWYHEKNLMNVFVATTAFKEDMI